MVVAHAAWDLILTGVLVPFPAYRLPEICASLAKVANRSTPEVMTPVAVTCKTCLCC